MPSAEQQVEIPWTLDEINTELASRRLIEFVKQGWHVVEPEQPFVEGWHHGAICEHLEAQTRGQIKDLLICVPPRHTKSLITSVMWPAWEWVTTPGQRYLFSSYAMDLSVRDSVKFRSIVQSNWYRQRWGSKFHLIGEPKEKIENDKTGFRLATSVDGSNTGEGGGRLVVDDPHNVKRVESEKSRATVIRWWTVVMSSRRNDPKTSTRTIIMQRSHEGDLVGWILSNMKASWECLILPARFEESRRCRTSIGFVDPRIKEGDLLWSNRFGEPELKTLETELGSYAAAGQLQQRPSPAAGGIFKRHWFKFYGLPTADNPDIQPLPDSFFSVFQSWDMTFKETDNADNVSGGVWGVKGANKYLLDRVNARMDFVNAKKAVRAMTEKWPEARAKYVEDKANGPAVISDLQGEIAGLIPFNPNKYGSKVARAYAITPDFEAGNVYLPHPSFAPWVHDYIEELCAFDKGAHDDDVDMTSQALLMAADARHQEYAPIVSITRESPWVQQQPEPFAYSVSGASEDDLLGGLTRNGHA